MAPDSLALADPLVKGPKGSTAKPLSSSDSLAANDGDNGDNDFRVYGMR